jgi:hypothetical protein
MPWLSTAPRSKVKVTCQGHGPRSKGQGHSEKIGLGDAVGVTVALDWGLANVGVVNGGRWRKCMCVCALGWG